MISTSSRAKEAFRRGAEAAKAGESPDDNYYKYMGARGRYLAGHWERGYYSSRGSDGVVTPRENTPRNKVNLTLDCYA